MTSPGRRGVRGLLVGESSFDVVGRSRTWFLATAALLLVCILALAVRGLEFGIDFTGGTAYVVSATTTDFTVTELRDALAGVGVTESTVQVSQGEDGPGALVSTPSVGAVGGEEQAEVLATVQEVTGTQREDIDVSAVGPRWGAQISRQALQALVVFLVLVVAYLALRFEWRMAVAALAAMAHDVFVTVGIYALIGFEVTPSSVIALLTILGYSLYDTAVVFDRVREETSALTSVATRTYGQIANDALNHVLVRSLSTSVTSLLPVGSLLFIGATLLGADTLRDLALALFVGMAVGTYSSIFVATPLLVTLKEREPRYAELKERVTSRATAKST